MLNCGKPKLKAENQVQSIKSSQQFYVETFSLLTLFTIHTKEKDII